MMSCVKIKLIIPKLFRSRNKKTDDSGDEVYEDWCYSVKYPETDSRSKSNTSRKNKQSNDDVEKKTELISEVSESEYDIFLGLSLRNTSTLKDLKYYEDEGNYDDIYISSSEASSGDDRSL